MFPHSPERVIRHPVSLAPIPDLRRVERNGYYELRAGGLSQKNRSEMAHFLKAYKPLSPEQKCYANKKILPAPEATKETLILDIGCGPYDCISAIPGQHFFLDDIMDLYCDELKIRSDGMRICGRTELMPFADDSIDVIYSINMIDHVDDMPETLLEMYRILKPNGRIYLQSYYNSHPLLKTEPGVFDWYFEREHIRPLFHVHQYQTYATGDPQISFSYTMDIVAAVLSKNTEAILPVRKPRDRYEREGYRGPQSAIAEALGALDGGDLDGAKALIASLEAEPFYEIQHKLLTAAWSIAKGEGDRAEIILKDLLKHDRVRKNPFARIATLELLQRRIAKESKR